MGCWADVLGRGQNDHCGHIRGSEGFRRIDCNFSSYRPVLWGKLTSSVLDVTPTAVLIPQGIQQGMHIDVVPGAVSECQEPKALSASAVSFEADVTYAGIPLYGE